MDFTENFEPDHGQHDVVLNYGAVETPLDSAINTLARASRDRALADVIKNKMIKSGLWENLGIAKPLIKQDGPPPAFPPTREISLIQTAIFDNWPKGHQVQNHPNRYGCALEIWTTPKEQISFSKRRSCQFKTNMSLMDAKAFKAMIRTLKRPRLTPIEPDYLESMDGILEMAESDDWLVGLVNTSIQRDDAEWHRGTYYHANQFLLVRIENGVVERAVLVLSPSDKIELAPFDPLDAAGRPHSGNVILQSRHDLCGWSEKKWATNVDA
jgi:hypothetical protein